jgi:hypothetical protein
MEPTRRVVVGEVHTPVPGRPWRAPSWRDSWGGFWKVFLSFVYVAEIKFGSGTA